MSTLRSRLTWAMVAVVGISMLLADIGAVVFLRAMLTRDLALSVELTARQAAALYATTGQVPRRLPLDQTVAIYTASGELVESTGRAPLAPPPPGLSVTASRIRDNVPIGPGAMLVVSQGLRPVNAPVTFLEDALAVLTILALLLAALISMNLSRRLSTPLAALAEAADRIAETGDLEHDLPGGGPVRETATLGQALSRMLGTLRGTFHALEASEARARALREVTLHDLRTPLTTVLGALELLEHGQVSGERAHEAVALARREAGRLAERVRAGTEGGPAEADLLDCARRVAGTHPVHGLSVGTSAPRAEVEQVIALLVDNAERHNPERTVISLTVGRADGMAYVEVSDTGRGMTQDELSHAFDRFYRGAGSGGLGLGLPLAKVLVESRGGSCELESAPGRGTRVRVTWPMPAAEGDVRNAGADDPEKS